MAQKIGNVERVDLIIRTNATFKLTLSYQDPLTGAALPLTGWDVKMQFRDQPGGTLLSTFTTSSGFTIDAPNGVVNLKIQPDTIQAWAFSKGWYDIILTDPILDEDCWLEGVFEVKKGITL
jgi:hypothetical protein